MGNGLHATMQRGRELLVLGAGILLLCWAANAAVAASAQAPEPAKLPEEKARLVPVDVRALHEQIQGLQKELAELTAAAPVPGDPVDPVAPMPTPQPFDEQTRQLIQQRENLFRAIQQLQNQLKQVQAGREDERRKLQDELDTCQQRLRALDEQMAEAQRERIRADYLATLQTQAQQRAQREQSAQAAAQVQNLTAQLQALRQQAEQTQQQLEQLQDKTGPQAEELQKGLEEVRRQTQAMQNQLRAMEQERQRERQEVAEHQRAALEAYVRELGRNQELLKQSVAAIRQQVEQVNQERQKEAEQWQATHQILRALQEQVGATEQRVRTASEEAARANVEKLRRELTQQREELRSEVGRLNEQLQGALAQTAAGTTANQRQWNRLRADVRRMEQTFAGIEQERLNTQTSLSNEVQELRQRVDDLGGSVVRVQGTLHAMLAQSDRSTVGSAGYTWGW